MMETGMRYPAMIIALLVSIAFANQAFAAQKLKPWQAKALELIKKEKKVVKAKWRRPGANVLHVAMQSDGSRRDGFAQYLCMVLPDAGAPKGELKTIFIYDPAAYKSDSGSTMGLAACR